LTPSEAMNSADTLRSGTCAVTLAPSGSADWTLSMTLFEGIAATRPKLPMACKTLAPAFFKAASVFLVTGLARRT